MLAAVARTLNARYAGRCASCGVKFEAGAEVCFDDSTRRLWHPDCAEPSVPAEPARLSRIRARYASYCAGCHERTLTGDEIVYDRLTRSTYHRDHLPSELEQLLTEVHRTLPEPATSEITEGAVAESASPPEEMSETPAQEIGEPATPKPAPESAEPPGPSGPTLAELLAGLTPPLAAPPPSSVAPDPNPEPEVVLPDPLETVPEPVLEVPAPQINSAVATIRPPEGVLVFAFYGAAPEVGQVFWYPEEYLVALRVNLRRIPGLRLPLAEVWAREATEDEVTEAMDRAEEYARDEELRYQAWLDEDLVADLIDRTQLALAEEEANWATA